MDKPSLEAGVLNTPIGGALRTLADAADHVSLALHHGREAYNIVRGVWNGLRSAWSAARQAPKGKDT